VPYYESSFTYCASRVDIEAGRVGPFDDKSTDCCFTHSRRGALGMWLQRTVHGYAAHGLDYLLQPRSTVLDAARLAPAIAALDALLKAIGDDPVAFLAHIGEKDPAEYAYEPPEWRERDERMVCNELALPVTLPEPQGYCDEGDSWAYMIGFLKSHRRVLQMALEAGLCACYSGTGDEAEAADEG
jgi:hypothetical protein